MLIIGANSTIGGEIAKKILKNEHPEETVVSTIRKPDGDSLHDWLLLDLSEPSTFSSIRGRTFGTVFFLCGRYRYLHKAKTNGKKPAP